MTQLLNVDILSIRKKKLLKDLQKGVLFTPNVDHLVRLQKDKNFYKAYQLADWIICDSVILYRLSKLLKHSIVERIPGSTFFFDYCDFHRKDDDCKIFILGGKKGIATKAMENVNKWVGKRMVIGAHSPSFSFVDAEEESRQIVQMIRNSGATVLIVCATSPKQEFWITQHKHQLPEVRLFMALGATVDFAAGAIKRCPVTIQKMGMEWFWRFCQEPRRLFHRYFIRDMQFFWYFGKQLLGIYKNPFA